MGAVAVAAFPPYHVIPALIPAFTVLIWLARSSRRKRDAFLVGLSFGLGHFFAGLYWIANAFFVVGGPAAIAAWPAVAGLSSFLALYPALVAMAFRLICGERTFGIAEAAVFAALWTVGEWLRGWIATGFPWNPVGSVWVVSDAMLQITSLVGVFGLGMATAFAASVFAGEWWHGGGIRRAGRWRLPAAAIIVLGLIWGFGAYRLEAAPAVDENTGVALRLVQPNIPQRLKWQRDLRPRHVQDQIAMSRAPASPGQAPSLVIWAETATPFYMTDDAPLLAELARAVPEGGYLITGGLRRDSDAFDANRFNSLAAIDGGGRVRASYDKVHLVPFGEYMPFADVLPFGKLTAGTVDFTAGATFEPIDLPGLPPMQPLICYEAIFPGGVVNADGPRPDWLLNITNDAWYGMSSGPYQHLAMVRIRAIEEGLPLVRVANTGISAVIDSFGRITAKLPLGEQGVVDAFLPSPISPTAYAVAGNLPVVASALILIIFFAGQRLKSTN